MKDKITLKQFFESKEKLAIHCDTEEKANKLLKEFDKLGKTWWTGDGYLENTCFHIAKDKTCYSNSGTYDNIKFLKDENYKIYSFKDIIFEEEAKPKNLIPEIAKMLGVEIGEEFKIKGWSSYPYKLTLDGVLLSRTNGNEWEHAVADDYEYVLIGKCVIEKLPKKPQLTDAERIILEELYRKYTKITRIENTNLWVFNHEYDWKALCALNHLFQFIKANREPYDIEELLKGE